MPFALNDTISLAALDGGIEITDQQYADAREAKLSGREALVIGGELVIRDPAPSPQHTWENGKWVKPVEPEPEPIDPLTIELPRREFRRALLHNGMNTAAVLSVINAIADPAEREEMTIWWEDTQNFQRQHPVLVQMVAAAGLTPEQADGIWAYGVGLLQGE